MVGKVYKNSIEITKSNDKLFFSELNRDSLSFNDQEVDSVINYFLKRGFDDVAAVNTALILLRQAGEDKVKVFTLIDLLKGLNDVQLSEVIAQIINTNRTKTSSIGYIFNINREIFDKRNIIV
jgi:hypothetical protein